MNQETQIVEIFLNYENYDDDDLKYTFRKKNWKTFWRRAFAT